jgi:hypothetical protein
MTTADHFGHRENNGVVVDLFWNRGRPEEEFSRRGRARRSSLRSPPHDGERSDPGLLPSVCDRESRPQWQGIGSIVDLPRLNTSHGFGRGHSRGLVAPHALRIHTRSTAHGIATAAEPAIP